ncbi:hypothetical protein [Legionella sp. W05-934-2]|jgi:hypothetical protein|uniref:hypothetical protein n=1 Tax=Legionella sp. W05-934-2 TaxID=1198649 RepID=UPI0034636CCD
MAVKITNKQEVMRLGDTTMDIMLKGVHNEREIVESLAHVFELFKQRYGIETYRELYLTLTLVDSQGDDVELVDTKTNEVFNRFDIIDSHSSNEPHYKKPHLKLVVDNSR